MVSGLPSIKNTWSDRAILFFVQLVQKKRLLKITIMLKTPKSSSLVSLKPELWEADSLFPNPVFVILQNNPTTVFNRLTDPCPFHLHVLLSCFNSNIHKCLWSKKRIHCLKIHAIGLGLNNFWLASATQKFECLFSSCRPCFTDSAFEALQQQS